jgi:MFS family permease
MTLWRHREFRTFWSAQSVSEFGDRITELALPLIAVTMLDASPSQVGLLTATVWLPNLVSLLIGTWVDQHARKLRLMIFADLARVIVLLTLPAAYWLDMLTLGHLYVIALVTGAAHVVFNMAYPAFFIQLVSKDQYLEANGKLSVTRSLSFVAGPAAGGGLIQWLTAPVALVVDALTFVFSAIQLRRIRTLDGAVADDPEPLLRRAQAGMAYVLRHPYLRASLGCATTLNFFAFIGSALLVLFASRNLQLSAGMIGLVFGIGATGGLLGAVTAGPLARWLGAGRVIAVGAVGYPAAVAPAAFATGPLWARAGLLAVSVFIAGVTVMWFDVPHNSVKAAVIHHHLRSRVAGAYSSINYGIRPLGAVVGGLLGSSVGVRETLLISAAGGVFALLWLLRSPIIKVRDITTLQPPQSVTIRRSDSRGVSRSRRTRSDAATSSSSGPAASPPVSPPTPPADRTRSGRAG